MAPGAPMLDPKAGLGGVGDKRTGLFRGTQFDGGQFSELGSRESVVAQRGGVERQETKRAEVEDPHRLRIFLEQEPILFLGFSKFLFALFSQGNFSLQLLIGMIQLSGPTLDQQLDHTNE